MRIALYGGSFNPPHLGHRAAALTVTEKLRPDLLLVIPDHTPPHKALPEDSPPAEERLALCELTFAGIPKLEISDLELRREGASYTADTVEQLRAQYPRDELYLVVGTDMLLCFEQWYRFRYLLEQCVLTVLCRAEDEQELIDEKAEGLRSAYGAKLQIIAHEPIEISSGELRELLPRRLGRDELTPAAYAEIIRRRWYGAQPELAWLREMAYAMLKPKRIAHVAGCESEAVSLATHWGEDPELAAEAAILHDITKRQKGEAQLELCRRYGLQPDREELACPNVLHAITGAAAAVSCFGVCDAVRDAIRWHCTGKPDMTLLEKIVWLADFIEPTRDFPGVDEVRSLAYEDINLALSTALRMTLEFVDQKSGPICTWTKQASAYYAELSERR